MERAHELGCNTAQIFSHNPRTWSVGAIPTDSVALFRQFRKTYDIEPVFVHCSYLINCASSDSVVRERSVRMLIQELDLADLLGAEYVVLHTGSASLDTAQVARKRAIDSLRMVSEIKTWQAGLLLENTAGERGDISSRIKDLAEIIKGVQSPLIKGVVIDSCHAFQAGYELSGDEGLSEMSAEIAEYLAPGSVKLIHLNDSKRPFGARVDRHDHIGSGSIGRKGIARLINDPAFIRVPLILETPKKSDGDDRRNLCVVRRLMK
jgi:deoxyribonuclease-4